MSNYCLFLFCSGPHPSSLALSDFDGLHVSAKQVDPASSAGDSSSAPVDLDQVLNLADVQETKGNEAGAGDAPQVIAAFEEKKPEPPVAGDIV